MQSYSSPTTTSKNKSVDLFRLLIIFNVFILFTSQSLSAQNDTLKYDITISGLISSGKYSPFWLQSNQYDKISSGPNSTFQMGSIWKDFGNKKKLFDYGYKASLLIKTDANKSELYFHELYAKARFWVFDIAIGKREEQFGNQDSILSCGGFMFSKNARPLTKITLGIERFTAVPFSKGYVEVKGAISNGWFNNNEYIKNEMLHHKYFYMRVGGKLPVHLQYGLDHTALWGGNIKGLGQQPVSFDDFLTIFTAKGGGSNAPTGEQINALGDHRISQSMRLDISISDFKLAGYWQNFSEDSPIEFMTQSINKPDGLWGITIRNYRFPFIKGILYEYLNTTDQSGPYLQKDGIIYGGADSYFSNYIYTTGWSYYSKTIGTPFISSPIYNENGVPCTLNNRVQVHHVGIEGSIGGYSYKAMASFSKNYGTYAAPFYIQNTSTLLEINKQFPEIYNIEVGCSLGADVGKLYGNSFGIMLSLRKKGNLLHY